MNYLFKHISNHEGEINELRTGINDVIKRHAVHTNGERNCGGGAVNATAHCQDDSFTHCVFL